MSYFKQCYEDNNCRICKETFCCSHCRAKHEESTHNIFPNCDICIFGKVILTHPSEDLLNHIKRYHWPLHCVYCKRLFGSIKELIVHNKCPIGPQKLETISNTPMRPIICVREFLGESNNIESPPTEFLSNSILLNQRTSTPMQSDEKVLDCFPDAITPVDRENQYAKENLSHTPNINEEQKKTDDAYKRKVTFSETPTEEHTRKIGIIKGSLKKIKQESIQNTGIHICVEHKKNVNNYEKPGAVKERKLSVNETLWESALNGSVFETDESIFISKENIKIEEITRKKSTETYNQSDNSDYSLRFPRSSANLSANRTNDSPPCVDNNSGSFYLKPYIPANTSQKPSSIWSSMTYFVKNLYDGFSGNNSLKQNKRHFSETDCNTDNEIPQLKRIKLTEIKCRSPIRRHKYGSRCVIKVDKATQTD